MNCLVVRKLRKALARSGELDKMEIAFLEVSDFLSWNNFSLTNQKLTSEQYY